MHQTIIEFALLALLVLAVNWLWTKYRNGRWDNHNPAPAELWDVRERRDYSAGYVSLIHCYGQWAVQKIPHERTQSTVAWFHSERKARREFAKVE